MLPVECGFRLVPFNWCELTPPATLRRVENFPLCCKASVSRELLPIRSPNPPNPLGDDAAIVNPTREHDQISTEFLNTIEAPLKSFADVVSAGVKIAAVLSAVLMTIFTGAYLNQFDLPFVPLGADLLSLVQVFAISTFVIFIYIATLLYIPANKYLLQEAPCRKLFTHLSTPKVDSRRDRAYNSRFVREYAWFYSAAISFLPFALVLGEIVSRYTNIVFNVAIAVSFLLGISLTAHKARWGLETRSDRIFVIGIQIVSNILSLIWITAAFLIAYSVMEKAFAIESPTFSAWLGGLVAWGTVVSLHALLMRFDKVLTTACAIFIAAVGLPALRWGPVRGRVYSTQTRSRGWLTYRLSV